MRIEPYEGAMPDSLDEWLAPPEDLAAEVEGMRTRGEDVPAWMTAALELNRKLEALEPLDGEPEIIWAHLREVLGEDAPG